MKGRSHGGSGLLPGTGAGEEKRRFAWGRFLCFLPKWKQLLPKWENVAGSH